MTPEIRLEAIKIAHAFHTDFDKVLESAGRLVHFISGTTAPTDDKPAATRTKAKPTTTEQTQPDATPSTVTGTPPAQTAAAQQPVASTVKQSVAALVYDDVKKLILKLTPVNRSAAMKILQDHGVAKGPDLKPEQYDSAHNALTEALAAHEAAKVA